MSNNLQIEMESKVLVLNFFCIVNSFQYASFALITKSISSLKSIAENPAIHRYI